MKSRTVILLAIANAFLDYYNDTSQIQCNEDLFKIVINMMSEHTKFARNYFDKETFRNFVNSRVFQQARAIV